MSVEQNVSKLFVFRALRWFLLIVPVMVPFFQASHLTMEQIMILQSAFSLAVVLLEVPSGYVADCLGRRKSIIIGSVFALVGFAFYSLTDGFWGFLVAELILGFGGSFISGADTALLYDSLLQLERQDRYKRLEGVNSAIGSISEGIAAIAGGLLAAISIRLPFYVETIILIPALLVAFSLTEPAAHAQQRRKASWSDIFAVIKYATHECKELRLLLLYCATVGASTLTMVWFIQPYFKEAGLPLALYGVAWSVLQFSVAGFSLIAHKVEKLVGRSTILFSLIFLSAGGFFILGMIQSLWALPVLFIFYFVRGMNGPLLGDYINRLTPSSMRATVLSLNALLFRLFFSLMGPAIGHITDHQSLGTGLKTAGVVFACAGGVELFFLWKGGCLDGRKQAHG